MSGKPLFDGFDGGELSADDLPILECRHMLNTEEIEAPLSVFNYDSGKTNGIHSSIVDRLSRKDQRKLEATGKREGLRREKSPLRLLEQAIAAKWPSRASQERKISPRWPLEQTGRGKTCSLPAIYFNTGCESSS
ncbi:hypothetical protein Fot_15447 [Forsythia ovata]|uniref:Uncharacterized protein n=1 Tax=Forsythia ovata TaxID=205694 RepID=A0ABD1W995_9LAMI